MKVFILLSFVLIFGFFGCVTVKDLQNESSTDVGCAPQEIVIKDQDLNSTPSRWTAVCGEKEYFCSMITGNTARITKCKEKQSKKK